MNVLIVNYNSGNLASLYNSFLKATKDRKKKINLSISDNPNEVKRADKIILPGVGDFSNCKNQLVKIEGMEELEGGEASIREFYIKSKSKNIGIPIIKLGVPKNTLIAMVNRNGEPLFPDDEFIFEEGDHVLVFTLKDQLPNVEKFFY